MSNIARRLTESILMNGSVFFVHADAYAEDQIRFEWNNVDLIKGMVLSQYDLIEIPKYNVSHKVNSGKPYTLKAVETFFRIRKASVGGLQA